MKKSLTVTTPIFYVNSNPHIGTAHTMILSDFIKRSFKLINYEVNLITGTDEHGEKVAESAQKQSMSPEKFVDEKNIVFKDLAKKLWISYDRFIRTTEIEHKEMVKWIWNDLREKKVIYKDKYRGYYSKQEETFFTEKELIDGKSPNGSEVYFLEQECFFLSMESMELFLEEYLVEKFLIPYEKIPELKFFLRDLRDLCISRNNSSWGINVPGENSTIYVWFDALINYLTVSDFKKTGQWRDNIHVIGKDISRFHCLYWPCLLKHLGIKNMPKVLIHDWWIIKGSKMSKSLGNVIDPLDIIENYGMEVLRFYCIKESLIGHDSSFDFDLMIQDFNSLVVNKFSNLIYRTFKCLEKCCSFFPTQKKFEIELILEKNIENLEVKKYVKNLLNWCDNLNATIDRERIWTKNDKLLEICQEIHSLSKYFIPILPTVENWFNKPKAEILFTRIKQE